MKRIRKFLIGAAGTLCILCMFVIGAIKAGYAQQIVFWEGQFYWLICHSNSLCVGYIITPGGPITYDGTCQYGTPVNDGDVICGCAVGMDPGSGNLLFGASLSACGTLIPYT